MTKNRTAIGLAALLVAQLVLMGCVSNGRWWPSRTARMSVAGLSDFHSVESVRISDLAILSMASWNGCSLDARFNFEWAHTPACAPGVKDGISCIGYGDLGACDTPDGNGAMNYYDESAGYPGWVEVREADVWLNANCLSIGNPMFTNNYVASVVGHELGHVLGLDHSPEVALMNTERDRNAVVNPTDDDCLGQYGIYELAHDSTTTTTSSTTTTTIPVRPISWCGHTANSDPFGPLRYCYRGTTSRAEAGFYSPLTGDFSVAVGPWPTRDASVHQFWSETINSTDVFMFVGGPSVDTGVGPVSYGEQRWPNSGFGPVVRWGAFNFLTGKFYPSHGWMQDLG